jgi:hypothetical protein
LHLVYPIEVKPAVQIPQEEKAGEIRQHIIRQKKQQILRELAATLRGTAVIERSA